MNVREEIYLDHVGWLEFPANDDVIRYLRQGWFEYAELAFQHAFLREGDSFLDIGAHAGLHSATAAALVGSAGTVVCIEPNTNLHPYLSQNLSNFGPPPRIRGFAVAGNSGTRKFTVEAEGKAAYSFLANDEDAAATEVETRSLPDLWQTEDLGDVKLSTLR